MVALLLVLSGCGETPRQDFLNAADAICRDGGDRLVDVAGQDPAGQRRGIAVLDDMRRRLGALRPPPELRRDVDAYLETTRRQIVVLRRITTVAEDEAERIARSPAARELAERRRRLAERIGFDVCA